MTGTLLKLFTVALLLPQVPQETRPGVSSRKVEEYGPASAAEELSRLEKLRLLLEAEHEDTKAFIVAYAGRDGRPGDALARTDRAKQALYEKSFSYAGQLNTLDCGRRKTPSVELWITPVGASPPPCTPTLGPAAAPPVKEAPGPRRPARRRGARP